MHLTFRTSQGVLALLLAGPASGALKASGFQLREQSPSAQGNSFAGISAGGSDIGSMFFNVATLTRFQGNQAIIGFSSIDPTVRLEDGSASRATALGGSAISGNAGGNAGCPTLVPMAYGLWSLSANLKLGLSVNSPFGLGSEYESGWIGRYHALKSKMTIVEIGANVAWRVHPMWSLGAALVARHVDAELTNAVDFGAIGAAKKIPGFMPGGQDGIARVQGKQWKPGYKLGVLFEPTQALRVGVAYHSRMDFQLKGDVHYENVPAVLRTAIPDGDATPKANQPATASLGIAWDLAPAFTLQAEAARTYWKCMHEIRIQFASGQNDSVTEEKWKDTWFLALGCTWRPCDAWTLRTGLAYDQAATTDAYRTPRIPDADRTWLSVGAGYAFTPAFGLDLSFSHIFVQDSVLALQAGAPGSPDFLRGKLSGSYRSYIDVLSLQAKYCF